MELSTIFLRSILAITLGLLLNACGGGDSQTPAPNVTLSVAANPTTVPAGGTAQITAIVTNDPGNKGVTWKVACFTSVRHTFCYRDRQRYSDDLHGPQYSSCLRYTNHDYRHVCGQSIGVKICECYIFGSDGFRNSFFADGECWRHCPIHCNGHEGSLKPRRHMECFMRNCAVRNGFAVINCERNCDYLHRACDSSCWRSIGHNHGHFRRRRLIRICQRYCTGNECCGHAWFSYRAGRGLNSI